MKDFEPSHYQTAIFNWIQSGRGNAVVQAVAGSGKTTTLVQAASLLRSENAVFLAFNKHVATELQKRLGKTMAAKTIHSIGYNCLRSHLGKLEVQEDKYRDLVKPFADEIGRNLQHEHYRQMEQWRREKAQKPKLPEPPEPPDASRVAKQLQTLAHFVRVTLTLVTDRAAVEQTCQHFDCLEDVFTLDLLHQPLIELLRDGKREAENHFTVDYDDMLWLPNEWNLSPRKCEWIFVDESQDLSPAQLELVLKLRGRGGRILFVGDEKQAIYGFAGASSDSIKQIIKRTKAITLPLSICYRCPKKHIELAKKIVSAIEPKPDAPEGIVEDIAYKHLHNSVKEGDLIISRRTAPAVKLCIELIAKRIPARVRGRDIGKSLTAIVKEIAKRKDFDFTRFGKLLEEYKAVKIAKLRQRKASESQIDSLSDRVAGVQICYEAYECQTVEQLCDEIEQLFSDQRSSVVLSTVHRAKGLENERVFILRPEDLPLLWQNQQSWELEQEYNLKYVALTRAKAVLYFVNEHEGEEDSTQSEVTELPRILDPGYVYVPRILEDAFDEIDF
ncbi:ATP-dependent helicase [Gloeocapsopsis crepidinum LEGE 06123]|uniref:DNA 3'-5' helicase n=1 Tax=Gloeocapsopsis crepidinum LEGE 06123 TaxID=588587 RepID=A0ABR9USZ8_9CHRO|nr:ATP-dependent helicase [Gloeocapsopsis crepidinum]MBE9191427.1 ATP-dependent helicase [Gloeocapsopsis crepidinum LEGE 06123]